MSTPNLVRENEPTLESVEDDMTNFWPTSAGKFHFCIEELPQELQYIHQLLQVCTSNRIDILALYVLVTSLRLTDQFFTGIKKYIKTRCSVPPSAMPASIGIEC